MSSALQARLPEVHQRFTSIRATTSAFLRNSSFFRLLIPLPGVAAVGRRRVFRIPLFPGTHRARGLPLSSPAASAAWFPWSGQVEQSKEKKKKHLVCSARRQCLSYAMTKASPPSVTFTPIHQQLVFLVPRLRIGTYVWAPNMGRLLRNYCNTVTCKSR